MKAWYIHGYTNNGAIYCRDCVGETLNDDSFLSPYCTDEHSDFQPIFSSDLQEGDLEEFYCEYCFESLDNPAQVV